MTGTTKRLLLASAILSSLGFVACSDDGGSDTGTGGTGAGGMAMGGMGTGGVSIGAKGGAVTSAGAPAKGGATSAGGATTAAGATSTSTSTTVGGATTAGGATSTSTSTSAGGTTSATTGTSTSVGGTTSTTTGTSTSAGGTTSTTSGTSTAAGGTTSATTDTSVGGTTSATTTAVTTTNLLVNGDMEAATIAPWTGNGGHTVAITTTGAHGGTNALVGTGRTQPWMGPGQSLLPLVTAGTIASGDMLYVSAWVKVSTASAKVSITLDTADGTTSYGNSSVQGVQVVANNTSWTKISQLVPLIWDTTPTWLYVYFKTFDETGTFADIYLDDVSAVKVPNVLANSGFENGTTGWTSNGATTPIAADTTVFKVGTASGMTSGRANTWEGPAQDISSSLVSGRRMAVALWARVDMATPADVTVAPSIELTGTDVSNRYPWLTNFKITAANVGKWVKIQTDWGDTAMSTWTAATTGKFYVQADNTAATIYVDNVTLGFAPE